MNLESVRVNLIPRSSAIVESWCPLDATVPPCYKYFGLGLHAGMMLLPLTPGQGSPTSQSPIVKFGRTLHMVSFEFHVGDIKRMGV